MTMFYVFYAPPNCDYTPFSYACITRELNKLKSDMRFSVSVFSMCFLLVRFFFALSVPSLPRCLFYNYDCVCVRVHNGYTYVQASCTSDVRGEKGKAIYIVFLIPFI